MRIPFPEGFVPAWKRRINLHEFCGAAKLSYFHISSLLIRARVWVRVGIVRVSLRVVRFRVRVVRVIRVRVRVRG